MNINNNIATILCLILFIPALILCAGCSRPEDEADVQSAGRPANIQPDYSGIIIPPNIAPLNFIIRESGQEYLVRIHSKQGNSIRIQCTSNCICIPLEPWKRLLADNPGEQLIINVSMKNQNSQWIRFFSEPDRTGIYGRLSGVSKNRPGIQHRKKDGNFSALPRKLR